MSVRNITAWNWNTKSKLLIVPAIAAFIAIFAILYRTTEFGKSVTVEQEIKSKNPTIVKIIEKNENPALDKIIREWLTLAATIAIPISLHLFQRSERQKADINSREEAMLTYFKHISELLVDKELKSLITEKQEDANFKNPKLNVLLDAARACTLSILRRLDEDKERKGRIIGFLSDAGLIGELNLELADLKSANLENVKLKDAKLGYAKLSNANLKLTDERISKRIKKHYESSSPPSSICDDSGVKLYCADLRGADLSGRFLRGVCLESALLNDAILEKTDLRNADLSNADLSNANLKGACLLNTILDGADLTGAILPDGTKYDKSSKQDISKIIKQSNLKNCKSLTHKQ